MLIIQVVLDERKYLHSLHGVWNVKVVWVLIIEQTKGVLKGLASKFLK